MIKKFRKTGSLLDKNRNRQKSVLTPGILQDIQMAITRSSPQIFAENKYNYFLVNTKYGPLLSWTPCTYYHLCAQEIQWSEVFQSYTTVTNLHIQICCLPGNTEAIMSSKFSSLTFMHHASYI